MTRTIEGTVRGTDLAALASSFGGELREGSRGPGGGSAVVRALRLDSREVEPGDLFVALAGARADGASFVDAALARGAVGVLAPVALQRDDVTQWIHPDARRAAGFAAALLHGDPSRSLTVVAVTGTNGKTTVAHLVDQLFSGGVAGRAKQRPGVLGTAGNRLADGAWAPASHTTVDAPSLQRMLARHRAAGGNSIVLEASSHALAQERLAGLDVDVAIFTNLTRDHLDYHGDLAAYAHAKSRLFASLRPGAWAVVRSDDPAAGRMIDAARSAGASVVTYGIGSCADLCASRLEPTSSGTTFFLSGMGISGERVCSPLAGRFNVGNALAALAAGILSGASPSAAVEGLAAVSPAPGRLERVSPEPAAGSRPDARERAAERFDPRVDPIADFDVYVDYAHSADALANVLTTLRERLAVRGTDGRLICVFGCGGDRDRGKRAPMGEVVDRLADISVVTSDNPRGEEPERIIADVLGGMHAKHSLVEEEPERRRAIRRAVRIARAGDIVLIAGKGHETTQEFAGGRRLPFDDRIVARQELRTRIEGRLLEHAGEGGA